MSSKTPLQISKFVSERQHRMDVPQQWYGDEPNSYRKPWDSSAVRMLTMACWGYEQAAGNMAIPLVYMTVNEYREDFLCDRSYFPSTGRDLRHFEATGTPMFGIESRHQLKDFDVVSTSISYPVLSINFAKQLTMSDVPPTWEDREIDGKVRPGRKRNPEKWPFILVGGQCYGAPEVVANIADCVFVGEVEDEPNNPGLGVVLERIADWKQSGLWLSDRVECYRQLALEFSFLYFPMFVAVHYAYEQRPSVETYLKEIQGGEAKPSKQVIGYSSRLPGMRLPIKKRFVRDMHAVKALTAPPLLYRDPGMGSGDIEVGRGCPAWCTFCALTWRQKPYRQRSVEWSVEKAKELLRNTGGVHISPFSPDLPMHTQKKRLTACLLSDVVDTVDASSMRVDDFVDDSDYILLQAQGGMDTVTLGVEGNSQRMRDLVGKGAADEDIKESVARGIRAGINKFKLYMIFSIPGEDEYDFYKVMALAKDLADIRDSMGSKALIQFSWTPLLIEGNTPFQWFSPPPPNYKLGDVWEKFRDLNIDFKLGGKSQRDKKVLFQLTQRASREVGLAIVEAITEMDQGCWGGAPKGLAQHMVKHLHARGFLNGIADAYDERNQNDMFGWEMLDQGVSSQVMWNMYQQMVQFIANTDSKTYDETHGDEYHGQKWVDRCNDRCMGNSCGQCGPVDLKIRQGYVKDSKGEVEIDLSNVKIIDQKSCLMKVRCKVVKDPSKRFVMNDHWRFAVRRAAYRSDVPIAGRSVKFASDDLKMKDWTCGVDYVEFSLTKRLSPNQVGARVFDMNQELSGIQIADFSIYPPQATGLRRDVDLSLYEMELDRDPLIAQKAIDEWNATPYIKMVFREESRMGGLRIEEVNGRDYVDLMWLVRDGHRLSIRMLTRGKANPYLVYALLFHAKSWVEAAKYPAYRVEAFTEVDDSNIDFFRPLCEKCEGPIPINLLDQPFNLTYCPKCSDEMEGRCL